MQIAKSTTEGRLSLRGKLYALISMAILGMGFMMYLYVSAHTQMVANANALGRVSMPAEKITTQADALHDGLREAVLDGAGARKKGDAKAEAETAEEMKRLQSDFTAQFVTLDSLPFSGSIKAHIAEARPHADQYVSRSGEMLELALKGDAKTYQAAFPAYQGSS